MYQEMAQERQWRPRSQYTLKAEFCICSHKCFVFTFSSLFTLETISQTLTVSFLPFLNGSSLRSFNKHSKHCRMGAARGQLSDSWYFWRARTYPSCWALQGMQNKRMAVRGHRAACNLLSWEKEEHIPLLPSWLPAGDKALVWSPTEKHCFTSSLHFQPLAQNMTKRELQFIKNQPLGLIILLELTFILLLGQNAST